VSLGCVVDDEAQADQRPGTHQGQEAHHGPLDQRLAAEAGLRPAGTLLRGGARNREAVVPDDVAIVGERGLDDDLLVNVAVQAEARVPLVAQGVRKVTLQVHAIQSVR